MADGTTAVRYLLAHDASLLATVPITRIISGILPQGTALPAIHVQHVSTVRRTTTRASDDKFATTRVQVTVMAGDPATRDATLALVRAAVTRTPGTVDSCKVDSILIDIEGPDLDTPGEGIYSRSQDFRVHWNE